MKSVVGVLDCHVRIVLDKINVIIEPAVYFIPPFCLCISLTVLYSPLNYISFLCRWKFDAPLVSAASRQQSVVNTEDGH